MAPPLPIAALALRARNAKSAKERHDLAYFGWEASVRLAVAARPPAERARLAMPSTGDWVAALAAGDQIFDDPALLAAQRLLGEEGLGRAATPKTTTAARVLEGLAAYRNAILGHGAVRAPEFYERAGDILAAGLDALWERGVLWEAGARMVFVESVEVDAAGSRRARVLDLSGAAAHVIDPRGTVVSDEVLPRRLYQERAGAYRSLHPWVLFEAGDLRERVLFFNGRGRAARYLDYVGGEQLKGKGLAAVVPAIEADLDAAMLPGTAGDGVEARDAARFGDYRILGKLGEGGMGVVYLARQETLDRVVALKMLPAGAADDPVAVARFRREIAALARCEHPNVVKILAAGAHEGKHYYAMELVDGADLAEVARALAGASDFDQAVTTASERVRAVRQEAFPDVPQIPREAGGAPLPARPRDRIRAIGALFRDAARALDHLHGHGIVHRDVKPANLMVTAGDHRVVLMDLGLATIGDASQTLTRDKASILGTLRYLPPEQLQRSLVSLDRRADIYALGATFYELLTGKPFLDGDSEARLIEQVLREKPVDPRVANPALPRDLAVIVSKATEKDPKLRYDDAEALARDLEAWLDGRPITGRPPSVGYLLRLAIRRHRAIAATVAVAILLATAGATWFLIRERQLRAEAEGARDTARASEQRTRTAFAWNLVERGQQELAGRQPARAAAYLAAAYPILPDEPSVRFLVADAMRDTERALHALDAHTGSVVDAQFSRDGQRVVTASHDGTARIWDTRAGRLVATLAHDEGVQAAVFSPEGTRVATASRDQTARLWDAVTGRPLATLEHTGPVRTVVFSGDGQRLVTASDDRTARVWDAASGRLLATLEGHTGRVRSAELSPDGRQVVTASDDHTAAIWDAATGRLLVLLQGHTDVVVTARFAPDGQRVVTASDDYTARVWDVTMGRAVTILKGNGYPLIGAAFSPDGQRLLIASGERVARIWQATTGALITTFEGHTSDVISAVFSADGTRVATGSLDGTARLWDAATGMPQATLQWHVDSVWTAVFSPDGAHVVTASRDGDACLWDAGPGRVLATLEGHTGRLESVRFSPDGERALTASTDGTARLWDLATGAPLVTLEGHTDGLWSAELSPDGRRVVTASSDGTARVWDAAAGALLITLKGHTETVLSAAFSPNGAQIVTSSTDDTARVWDAGTGRLLATLEGHTDNVAPALFSPDGQQVLTASSDNTARLWDPASGRLLATLEHGEAVATAAFSPDGRRVVTASSDHTAAIWDAASGVRLTTLEGHLARVMSAAFSRDGQRVVTGSLDQTAMVWDAASGKSLARLEGHTDWIRAAEFSPDGHRVVTASHDFTAAIWDAASGRRLATLEGHPERVLRVAFSPDGRRLLTGSYDRTARLWDVHLETRPPEAIAAVVGTWVPWSIVEGRLVLDP